jgi:hypothetical protein
MTMRTRLLGAAWLLAGVLAGCGGGEGTAPVPDAPSVSAWIGGTITVSADVDSTADYSGIQVLVLAPGDDGDLDTLGAAATDAAGAFETALTASERGIYPLLVRRRGQTFAQTDLVVADGDSTTLQAELPVRGARGLRLRSPENSAYAAYRNARAQHAATARGLLPGRDVEALATAQQQAASVLWSLRDNYAGTLGAELATVEAVALLAGVDDARAVRYAEAVGPSEAAYVPTTRVARKAIGLRAGIDSAAVFLEKRRAAADPTAAAAIQAELVQAYLEAERRDEALAAARALRSGHPDTPFAEWAARAEYEAEHLLPGLPAPDFTAASTDGPFTLSHFRGRHVVLEFYEPGPGYANVLPILSGLAEEGGDRLALVSVSVADPDRDALFAEGRTLPGYRISAGAPGADLPKTYNVNVLPTRFLIGPDGAIVQKFVGATLPELQRTVLARLQDESPS